MNRYCAVRYFSEKIEFCETRVFFFLYFYTLCKTFVDMIFGGSKQITFRNISSVNWVHTWYETNVLKYYANTVNKTTKSCPIVDICKPMKGIFESPNLIYNIV